MILNESFAEIIGIECNVLGAIEICMNYIIHLLSYLVILVQLCFKSERHHINQCLLNASHVHSIRKVK